MSGREPTPEELAAARKRALEGGQPPAPDASAPSGAAPIDFKAAAQHARGAERQAREQQAAAAGADAWGTRRDRGLLIDIDQAPEGVIKRAVDLNVAKEYGPMSRQAIETITKFFGSMQCSELHFDAPDKLFAKVNGERVQVPAEFSTEEEYNRFMFDLIRQAETDLTLQEIQNESRAVIRMAGGDRMALLLPPVTDYIHAAIHKVVARGWKMDDIVSAGTLTGHMASFLQAAVRAKANILVCGEMGAGKSCRATTPVLTPGGWKPIGELCPGDTVTGRSGEPCQVTGVFPQGKLQLFKVTFSDGASVECSDDHLWEVQTPLRKWRGNESQVLALREIRTRLHDAAGNARWFIPMVEPGDFEHEKPRTLDPYLLGLLLGDGCFADQAISFSTADPELADALSAAAPAGVAVRQKRTSPRNYLLSGATAGRSVMRAALEPLGLLGTHSWDKHIPGQYLWAPARDRLALLQGLLDTDGSASGGVIEYSTTSPDLADGVKFLVQSLGGRCRITERRPAYTHNGEKKIGRLSYRVFCRLPESVRPFRLQRKADSYAAPAKYQPTRAIVSVEPVDTDDAVCITVDAGDKLFVTNDFIVTHNSTTLALLAQEIGENERFALVEEVPELFIDKPDVVRATYYPGTHRGVRRGLPEVIDTLLYFRLDRMIVGEIHDKGMIYMLRAMSSGADGSMSTFHAGDVRQALSGVHSHVLREEPGIPPGVAADMVRRAIDLVVIIERDDDGKHRIGDISEVDWKNLGGREDMISTNRLFYFDRQGGPSGPDGRPAGEFVTDNRPEENGKVARKARRRRVHIDPAWFAGAVIGQRRKQ